MNRVSLVRFKDLASKSVEAAAGLIVAKVYSAEIERAGADDSLRQVRFRISTGSPDRMRDTIDPNGWELRNFDKNGPVLFAHRADQLPVAKSLKTWVEDSALKSIAQFATQDEYDFADTVYKLVKGGYLNAVSVGFQPLEWTINEERGDYAFDFKRQELLEYSIVPIPANPEALVEAKSFGVDVGPVVEWCEKFLDGARGPGLWVPVSREKVEQVRAAAVPSVSIAVPEPKAQADGDVQEPVHPSLAPAVSAPVAKKGRALSKANEAKLKNAQEQISKAATEITDVLAQVAQEEQAVEDAPEAAAEVEETKIAPVPALVVADVSAEPDYLEVDEDPEEDEDDDDYIEVDEKFFEGIQKSFADRLRREVIFPLTGRVD